MATIQHSIQINTNPALQAGRNVRATRTSKSRRYEACLVATVTVQVVERVAAALVEHESTVATLTPVLEGLLAAWGLTSHAEVEAIHEARTKPWYDVLFPAERAYREGRGRPHMGLSDRERAEVVASLVAQGHVNPYEQKEHTFLELARKLKGAMHAIDHIKEQNLTVGQQMVVSWHKDRANALKAKASAGSCYYRERGYSLEIRTDIEVTTK
jgi:hypothetical protein